MSELWLREESIGVSVHDVIQVQLTEIVQLTWALLYRRFVTSLKEEAKIREEGKNT